MQLKRYLPDFFFQNKLVFQRAKRVQSCCICFGFNCFPAAWGLDLGSCPTGKSFSTPLYHVWHAQCRNQTLRWGWGGGSLPQFFSALRASVWSNNKGGPPLDPPLIRLVAPQFVACEALTYFRSSLFSLRRYFSEGENRRPEMRLRFAGYSVNWLRLQLNLKSRTLLWVILRLQKRLGRCCPEETLFSTPAIFTRV